jgi:hypothetical protein
MTMSYRLICFLYNTCCAPARCQYKDANTSPFYQTPPLPVLHLSATWPHPLYYDDALQIGPNELSQPSVLVARSLLMS